MDVDGEDKGEADSEIKDKHKHDTVKDGEGEAAMLPAAAVSFAPRKTRRSQQTYSMRP
jgi:hypothetical protein